MSEQINIGGIPVDVVFKDIKNVHLSVYPPNGRVRIAAPEHMRLDTLRLYLIAKLDWIKHQQKKLQEQERETPREYLDRESHYLWGRRYLLKLLEADRPPTVELKPRLLVLTVRPGAGIEKKEAVVSAWHREQLRTAVPSLFEKWEPLLGVKVDRLFIQRMKTRWGSCNPNSGSIRLNSELAKKPPECLEYIVLHEMVHLLEPTHNRRFVALMDQFMPTWHFHRDTLNHLPVRHENWSY
jgi:predicted metal-dependent hydrolase